MTLVILIWFFLMSCMKWIIQPSVCNFLLKLAYLILSKDLQHDYGCRKSYKQKFFQVRKKWAPYNFYYLNTSISEHRLFYNTQQICNYINQLMLIIFLRSELIINCICGPIVFKKRTQWYQYGSMSLTKFISPVK